MNIKTLNMPVNPTLKKGLILLLFTLFFTTVAIGQTAEIDSLKNELVTAKEDTMKVRVLNLLAFRFYRIKPDTTITLATQGLELATKLDYAWGKGVAQQRIGLGYNSLGQPDKAIEYYNQSLVTFRAEGDSVSVSGTLLNMGSSFYGQGRFDDAISVFEQALVIAEAAGNQQRMAGLLNNLGVVALGKSNYPVALDYYQRSLKLKEELGLHRSASSTIQNMGSIYLSLKDFDKAQEAYDRALVLKIEANDKAGQAITLNNLGLLYVDKGEPLKALEHYREGYQINKTIGAGCAINYSINGLAESHLLLDQYDSARYYSNIAIPKIKECKDTELLAAAQLVSGAIFLKQGQSARAEKDLLSSIDASNKIDNTLYLQRASELLSGIYKAQGQFEKALAQHEVFKAATDSIFNESNTRDMTLLEAQYEFDQERSQLEAANERTRLLFDEELKRQALIRNGIIGGSIMLILLALNYYRSFRLKKKANELLEDKNQQLNELSEFKENLTHMIVHDMKNPLNAVIGLSQGEATQKKLHTIGQSGQQMLNMVSNMLDVQKFEEAKVTLNTEAHLFVQLYNEASTQLELLMHAKNIELTVDIDQRVSVDVDSELVVRIIGNLLSNAVKFSNLGGLIAVKAEANENEELAVSITDHGPGLQANQLKEVFNKFWQGAKQAGYGSSTGLGLTFCKLAVEAHGGKISVDSTPGKSTTFTFTLPIAHISEEAENQETEQLEREESLILESDIAVLSKYISELGNLKVHQVGKINQIIRQMDKEEVTSPWKTNLISAMHQGNQARFDELVEMLK